MPRKRIDADDRKKDDENKEIIDEIKKFFKINSDLFDIDFFVFPETVEDLDKVKKNVKGFKVSYHFENGMDKPDVKVEGDIDSKKLKEYLSKLNIKSHPELKRLTSAAPNKKLDAKELSLEPEIDEEELPIIEPYSETNECEDYIEVMLEVPGVTLGDVLVAFDDNEKRLNFTAASAKKKFTKSIALPFKASIDDTTMDVNNGIVVLTVKRKP